MHGIVLVLLGQAGCGVPDPAAAPVDEMIRERLDSEAWGDVALHGGAQYGWAIATADLDGDGQAEILVGAPKDSDPQVHEGSVAIWSGSATPAQIGVLEIDDNRSRFGSAIATGDIDGDGNIDVLVGAPRFETDHSQRDEGAVYLFLGVAGGTVEDTPAWSWEGDQAGALFGKAIVDLGDVDGDGADDFAVGAPGWDSAAVPDCGKTLVFGGGAPPSLAGEVTRGYAGGLEGWALTTSDSWRGMPFRQVITGAPGVGTVASYLASNGTFFTELSPRIAHQFGYSLASGHDLDHQPDDELVIGEPGAAWGGQPGAGKIHLYSTLYREVYGLGNGPGRFGVTVDLGDFEGDGTVDVLVGEPRYSDTGVDQGAVYELRNYGNLAALVNAWSQVGEVGSRLGRAVAAGDVNGDGVDDAVLGAPLYSGNHSGRVSLHLGIPDRDGDGDDEGSDCDDADPTRFHGATESCNGTDDDCDGTVDESGQLFYADADSDGYGIDATAIDLCSPPPGFVAAAGDCNDFDATVHPGAAELCNQADENCAGDIDEGFGVGDDCTSGLGECAVAGHIECDPGGATSSCDAQEGTPGIESCNGLDDDCDGIPDSGDIGPTWYIDVDGDGFGDVGTSVMACNQPSGYADNAADCDDNDVAVSPIGTEACNGYDDDCDNEIDEIDASGCTWLDADSDGYGDPTTCECDRIGGVGNGDDCYDGNALANPTAGPDFYDVSRGDGSFDYNCDLVEESNRPLGSCGVLTCQMTEGWALGVPACGTLGLVLDGCAIVPCFGCLMGVNPTQVTNLCR